VADLLTQLGWRDPLSLRHGHTFPVDALYQSNPLTEKRLQRALTEVSSGYISVVGASRRGQVHSPRRRSSADA
jgi:hypothetical protein